MHIIGDIIGIPEADRPDVFRWTDIIMSAPDPETGIPPLDHLAAGMRPLRVRGAAR